MVKRGIESTKTSLATESDEVWGLVALEIPVLVGPVLAGSTHSRLRLINNKWNSLVIGDISKLLEEIWSGHLIFNRADWLDDDGTNGSAGGLGVGDDFGNTSQASILLCLVNVLKVSERVFELGELGSWPWEGWELVGVYYWRTAGEGGGGGAVVGVVEAEDLQL